MSGDQGNVLLFKARGGGGWQTWVCCIIYFPAAPSLPGSPASGCWDPTGTAGTPVVTAGTPPGAQHPDVCSGTAARHSNSQEEGSVGGARVKKPPLGRIWSSCSLPALVSLCHTVWHRHEVPWPAPMVTLAGGLSPPVGTQSTPKGGHRGHRAHPGVLAHPPLLLCHKHRQFSI